MKNGVDLTTDLDKVIAGILADAPNSIEEFKRLYNANYQGDAPVFEAIYAGTNDELAARTLAAKEAMKNDFGWLLWQDFLRVTRASEERVTIARDLHRRGSRRKGLMQGIYDAAEGLGDANIFTPLSKITQATGLIYHEGLASPVRGTGFLVGPDLFLTAAHVIASVYINNAFDEAEAQKLLFKFPNKAWQESGVWPRIARLAPNGLVAASSPLGKPPDLLPDDDASACTCLDFALLKLDRPLGDDIGYVRMDAPAMPRDKQALVVIGHAGGDTPRFNIRKVIKTVQAAGRLRHNVNTVDGMSGSLCADPQARPVGLHEGVIKSDKGEFQYNRAVLLADIRNMMKKNAIDPLLEETGFLTYVFDNGEARSNWLEYGAAFRAQGGQQWRDLIAAFDPTTAAGKTSDSYHPIFGREDFQGWVDRARPHDSADRVMLVTGEDGCGKSFSTTILKARLRKSRDLVIPVAGEILRAADLHQIAEHILKHGERELQLRFGLGPVVRPAAAAQRYDQHDALFDAMRTFAGPASKIERLLWLVLDVGRDDGWTAANDALLKNLASACAARPWLRLVVIGVSEARANELDQIFTNVTVERDDLDMVQSDEFKEHARALAARYPESIGDVHLKRHLTDLWKEIENASKTAADSHLRCVEAVRSILQLRSVLLKSREAA